MTLSLTKSIVSNNNNNSSSNNIFAEGMEERQGGRRGRRSSRVRSRGDGKESAREEGGEDGGGVSVREKLKRHRVEVAGKVWIPEAWGQEELLEEWVDSSSFDLSLVPLGVVSARKALVQDQCRRSRSIATLQIDNRC